MSARLRGPARSLLSSALALALALTAGCVAPETRPGTPDHPAFQRAEQAMLLGDEDQALTLYRSYRQGFGNSDLVSECFLREGTILLKKGRIAEAERSFHEAIARPRSTFVAASAWVGVGDCRFSVDDYDGAATAYQRSLDLGARDARNDYALYRLGVSRQRSGDWEAGKSCYQLVLRDHEKSALKVRAEQRLRYPDRSLHLQVGAFQNEAGAKELETRLHAQGLIAKTVNVANGPAPYLVWVGDYDSVAIANRQLPAVKAVVGEGVILVP